MRAMPKEGLQCYHENGGVVVELYHDPYGYGGLWYDNEEFEEKFHIILEPGQISL